MLRRLTLTMFTSVVLLVACSSATAGEPVRLVRTGEGYALHENFKVLPDVDSRSQLDDFPALKRERAELFRDGADFSSIPFEINRYWLTFDVINETEREEWVIFIPMHLVNSVELIAVDEQGTRQYERSGEDLPPYTRPFNDFGNSLPITLKQNQRYQVAILAHDQYVPTLSIDELSLMDREYYNQVSFRLSATIIASLATMIVMGLFMLLLWWRIRDPTYGWYGLFSLATFVIWAVNYEFLRTLFLSTKNLYLANYLAMAAMLFFSAQLTRTYLELRRFSLRIDRTYFVYSVIIALWMCAVLFVPFEVSYIVSAVLALASLPILFSALFVTLRAGFRPARVYLVAWTLYFSNGALAALDGLGMGLSTASVRLLTVTSTAVGLIVMAYSVIQRIEQLRTDKLVAEQRARIDALTRLLNRTAFDHDCNLRRNEVRAGRIRDIKFAYLDLDGLKIINDTQGHHQGDQLLIAFTQNLRNHFRNEDQIYRMGGDEFILIFVDDDKDSHSDLFSERIATVIKNLRLSGFPDADCSFGIASLTETGGSLSKTIRLADQRMYQHKNSKKAQAAAPTPTHAPVN